MNWDWFPKMENEDVLDIPKTESV